MNRFHFTFLFMFAFILHGCGDSSQNASIETAKPVVENTTASAPAAKPAASGIGQLSGKILFSGTAPEREPLDVSADASCVQAAGGTVLSDSNIVNANGTLPNAFVYIKSGLPNKTYPTPKEPVVLDQVGCRYVPHVTGAQVNQELSILNSDPTLHNVHGMPENSKEFNLGMPIKGMKLKRKISSPEVMVKFKCDVHPWMSAYIGILPHPFFAVTGEDGTFEIKDVPAGTYTVEVWTESFGVKTQQVTVTDAQTASLDFQFSA